MKEKDAAIEAARTRLSAIQAHQTTSEGTLSSLEEAIADKDKQIQQLREQRDRAEQELKEECDLHEREVAGYKMKSHALDAEMEKLQVQTFCFCFFLSSSFSVSFFLVLLFVLVIRKVKERTK